MEKVLLNRETIHSQCDFESVQSCRSFLNNLYMGGERIEGLELADGTYLPVEEIPDRDVIAIAKQIRSWFFPKLKLVQ